MSRRTLRTVARMPRKVASSSSCTNRPTVPMNTAAPPASVSCCSRTRLSARAIRRTAAASGCSAIPPTRHMGLGSLEKISAEAAVPLLDPTDEYVIAVCDETGGIQLSADRLTAGKRGDDHDVVRLTWHLTESAYHVAVDEQAVLSRIVIDHADHRAGRDSNNELQRLAT